MKEYLRNIIEKDIMKVDQKYKNKIYEHIDQIDKISISRATEKVVL